MPYRKSKDWSTTKPPCGTPLANVNPGIALRCSFLEGAGNQIVNSVNPTQNGANSGATWVTGRSGPCLSFNGSSSYVNCLSLTKTVGSGDFSVAYWVNSTSASTIVAFATDGAIGNNFWTGFNGGAPGISVNGAAATSGVAANDGKWHYLTFVRLAGTAFVYVDAQQVATGSQSGTITTGSYAIGAFGSLSPSFFWNGKIDDVTFVLRAWSPTEIARAYTQPYLDFPTPRRRISNTGAAVVSGVGNYAYNLAGVCAVGH